MTFGPGVETHGLHQLMLNLLILIGSIYEMIKEQPVLVKAFTDEDEEDGRHHLGLSIDIRVPNENKDIIYNCLSQFLDGGYKVTMKDDVYHIDYVQDIANFKEYLVTLEV